MKTKEELNALKEEVESLNRKLTELTEDELDQIAGGGGGRYYLPSKDGGKPVSGIIIGRKPIDDCNDGNSWGPSWGEK